MEASDAFETNFVSRQDGILKRVLLRAKGGGYADLVFFRSKVDADRVAAAELTSEACHEFLSIMEAPDERLPDMGILSFEEIKIYE